MGCRHSTDGRAKKLDVRNIIQTHRGKCHKVSFDIGAIRKVNKVYAEYGIPTTEQIVAFVKSNIVLAPLTLEGLVFTENAVYFTPRHEKEDGTKLGRIPYSAFGSYLFFQEGTKGNAYAMSEDGDIRLLGGTLLAQNTAGSEVLSILQAIQRKVFLIDSEEKSKFSQLATAYLKKAKAELSIEGISERDDALLNMLIGFSKLADEAALIKAEALYRTFDFEKYDSFVCNLPISVSEKTRVLLKSVPDCFEENLMALLTDFDRMLLYKHLSVMYQNIPRDNPLSAYVCIRMNEYEWSSECIEYLREVHGQELAKELEWFRCLYSSHVMYGIYKAINNHEELPPACTKYRDAIGLTPLHYAIILKNEQAIEFLLKKKKLWKAPCPISAEFPLSEIYDYCVPAVASKVTNINDILVGTNESMAQLNHMIKSVRTKLGIKSVATRVQQSAYRTSKNAFNHTELSDANFNKMHTMAGKLDILKEKLSEASDNIKELEMTLVECEDTMHSMTTELIHDAIITLRKASKEEDSIAKYLYRMYTDPDFFMRVVEAMENQENLHLYCYMDFYFVAPDLSGLKLTYYE